MRYVILRDDDTNALTPIECLDTLYRPFLERCLPVNLAVIPEVATDALTPEGRPEGFLFAKNGTRAARVPINDRPELLRYLQQNPGFRVVQHGCHHDCFEFARNSASEISGRVERGLRLLAEAGFPRPEAFVAPHDKFSRASYREVARQFRVISSGWFELRRLPLSWWPHYFIKKARHANHWRTGGTILLSHPGCLLSAQRDFNRMHDEIVHTIENRRLTVLVTHWWEYFPGGKAHERFISLLHQTADYLVSRPDIKVISFADLTKGKVDLN
ncbi:MAG TPA: DUF2334 domain-containing protein [Verrucomicrobiae bacterium]|nr:DUF2334 domain-containing protein [Verrucomicrobiae bacterium]